MLTRAVKLYRGMIGMEKGTHLRTHTETGRQTGGKMRFLMEVGLAKTGWPDDLSFLGSTDGFPTPPRCCA